jgi:MFS family permease
MLFLAFFSTQNLLTLIMKLNGEVNLGYYLLAVLYLAVGCFSPFSSAILKRWGIKRCLYIGGLGHFCLVISSVLPSWKHEYHIGDD